jgi:hypothetical protein
MELTISDFNPLADPDQISPELLNLFDQAEQIYPEWCLDWFRLTANHALGPGQHARFICANAPGEQSIAAILPVMEEPGLHRISGLSTFYTSLFSPICKGRCETRALTPIFVELLHAGWQELRLTPLPHENATFETTLSSLRAAGWRAYTFFCFGNWYQPSAGLSFERYFNDRSSQVRNTYLRRSKKFLAEGRGRLDLVKCDAVEPAIQIWQDIYAASWKVPEPFPDFMPELIRLCARKNWLRMGIAYFDDRPIAAQIWIVHQGRAAIYKLAYDEKHARHSAGTLLTVFLMQHVLDIDKVAEVDYLIGDDPYKQDWVSHRRERWGIVAYNPRTLRGVAGWFREATGRLLKQWMKKPSGTKAAQ